MSIPSRIARLVLLTMGIVAEHAMDASHIGVCEDAAGSNRSALAKEHALLQRVRGVSVAPARRHVQSPTGSCRSSEVQRRRRNVDMCYCRRRSTGRSDLNVGWMCEGDRIVEVPQLRPTLPPTPAPTAMPRPGTQPPRWWLTTAAMRSVSPRCNGQDIEGILALVDELSMSGIKIVTLNAVYDAGAKGVDLWCGLSQSEPYKIDPYSIGGLGNWKRLVDKVHARNMSLLSWFNPNYFWTGSPYFKQAEADVRQYGPGLEGAPAQSPARWFKWSRSVWASANKPRDSAPMGNGRALANRWVWDADADAAYLSVWGDQPGTDFSSPVWQLELDKIIRHWLNMGLDGFVFDDPAGYISSGSRPAGLWDYEPAYINDHLASIVRMASGSRAVAMAELYGNPKTAMEMGLDASFDHDYPEFRGTKLVAEAVQSGSAASVEGVFSGRRALDAIVQRCYLEDASYCPIAWQRQPCMLSWLDGADTEGYNNYNCYRGAGATYAPESSGIMSLEQCFAECDKDGMCDAITVDPDRGWGSAAGELRVDCFKRGGVTVGQCSKGGRYSTFSATAPKKLRLLLAVDIAGGYLAAMEQGGDGRWWSNAAWPGNKASELRQLHGSIDACPAFGHASLRMRLALDSPSQYALLRFDALRESGPAAVAMFNFANTEATVTVSLPRGLRTAIGQPMVDCLTGAPVEPLAQPYTMQLPPYGFKLIGGIHMPRWERLSRTDTKNLHCYVGHGASWAPQEPVGMLSMAACFFECSAHAECQGVTVEWSDEDTSKVGCNLRGGLDAEECDAGDKRYSTFQWVQ